MNDKPVIGVTIGDFNGIGPELILKTFSNELVFNYCTPVIYANTYIFKHYANLLDHSPLNFNIVKKGSDIKKNQLNLRTCSREKIEITPGSPSVQAGKFALDALQMAIADIKDGLITDILTCPIDKKSITDAGLSFNGHTQYFASEFESEVQMILMNEELRVSMVTGHTPLNDVIKNITKESVLEHIRLIHENLKADFAIIKPKIAVLGINPHTGDNGVIGFEDDEILRPALEAIKNKGKVVVYGPYSADSFFGSKNYKNFDAILATYHDQGLIPFKTLAFGNGVNFTAGLSKVRTSPDHGTAYEIAGKGIADISSFKEAIYTAISIFRNRKMNQKLTSNPLRKQSKKTYNKK